MTSDEKDPSRITLTNGVVLRLKEVPRDQLTFAIRNALRAHPEPTPPMIYIANQGREEPNEADPDYLEARILWQIEIASRTMNVLYWDAVEVMETPTDFPSADSKEFAEYLEDVMGETPRASEKGRKVQWLRYRAIPEGDQLDVQRRLLRFAGVPEEDIREVEATFRDNAGGEPDSGSGDIKSGPDGD